ncbi:hypothetical protein HZC07_02695 [Candidatus Micrarchaeota archaeon]|nr:hypothetical protein [Candidatus Micrarchaeota archaeon]
MTSQGVKDEFNSLNTAYSIFGITIYKGDWVSGLFRSTEMTRIVNNLSTVLIIGLNAQSVLLEYLRMNMLNVFLPFGILLRSFYFTRGPGALMIALAIGMYFIFPIFFVLLDPGFTPTAQLNLPPVVNSPPYCYPTMSNTVSVLTTLENGGFGSSAGLNFAAIREDLAKQYFNLIIHPLVALSLTLVFIRYLESILGGDAYELTKMVGKVI